ncbi:hypothetical protein NMY22_g11153 [Coprinellus aureogranulatus]|nr:hypothetical protein NMY22_g11153 [Coprinellus aureogranulatus]
MSSTTYGLDIVSSLAHVPGVIALEYRQQFDFRNIGTRREHHEDTRQNRTDIGHCYQGSSADPRWRWCARIAGNDTHSVRYHHCFTLDLKVARGSIQLLHIDITFICTDSNWSPELTELCILGLPGQEDGLRSSLAKAANGFGPCWESRESITITAEVTSLYFIVKSNGGVDVDYVYLDYGEIIMGLQSDYRRRKVAGSSDRPGCFTMAWKVVEAPQIFALIIGNNEYEFMSDGDRSMDLRCAIADADAVENFFKRSMHLREAQTISMRNATRQQMADGFTSLRKMVEPAMDPCVVIFYAGHGAQGDRPPEWEGYTNPRIEMLCPSDIGRPRRMEH